MKSATFLSRFCGILAAVFLFAVAVVILLPKDAPAGLLSVPPEANALSGTLMDAVCQGDYRTAGSLMYGTPDLGVDKAPDSALGIAIWDALIDSLSYSFIGEWYATDSGIGRDVIITALDIPSVMAVLVPQVQENLAQELAASGSDDSGVYDENGQIHGEFLSQLQHRAAQEILTQGNYVIETTVSLNLVQEDGQWRVLPDPAFIRVITGGVVG